MRYEDRPMNGHHQPSWDLFGILLDLKHSVGGLETGQELMREQMTAGLDRVHERIDVVHQRIDTHLAKPPPGRPAWSEFLGLSPREAIGLLIVAVAAITGTLSSDMLVALIR